MDAKPVLIVDDEKNIRLTLSQAVEAMGLDSDTAVNGEEALAKLEEGDFGLMILDLKMPGMSGIDVLHKVREKRPDIKVIIITAHGTVDTAVEAMKLGAIDFIEKPFTPDEIRNLIKKTLDRDSLEAEQADTYEWHVEMARKCISDRQFDAAREHVRQATAADPEQAEAFNLLGALLEMKGERLEAQRQYRIAIDLDPAYEPAKKNLGRTTGRTPDEGIRLDD
ncbi:MAG: response regulator [Planctomycetota bacterium]